MEDFTNHGRRGLTQGSLGQRPRQGINGQRASVSGGTFGRPAPGGSNPPGTNNDQADSTDLPVKSWEAYKTWCDQIKDNWEEQTEESTSANMHPAPPTNRWNS